MKNEEILNKITEVLEEYPQIKLAYFFGSQSKGEPGPLSDFDFAFYVDEKDKQKIFDIKLELIDKISRILQTDKIDISILNFIESPELKYNIIKEGKLFYCKDYYNVLIEPKILNEYFDFKDFLIRNNLTKDA